MSDGVVGGWGEVPLTSADLTNDLKRDSTAVTTALFLHNINAIAALSLVM